MSNEEINQKAKELVEKYMNAEFGLIQEYLPKPSAFAKQCALIDIENTLDHFYWTVILFINENPMKQVLNDKIKELESIKQAIEQL
jgi:hypothetical protein